MTAYDFSRFSQQRQSTEPEAIALLAAKLRSALPEIDVEAFNVMARQLDMDECSRAGLPDGYWINQWQIYIGHHPEKPAEPWFVIEEAVSSLPLDKEVAPVGEVMGYSVVRNDVPPQSDAIFPRDEAHEQIVRSVTEAMRPKKVEQ